jgi:tRNA(Ile)-lysidine synthase
VLLDHVRAFAARHQLWGPSTRAIAAVSGGSDSVALLVLLRELHERGELILDCAAHLNHQIRGEAAAADEAFCRQLCERLNVEFVRGQADVPVLAARERVSIEVAARRARHAFLNNVLRERHADVVATAHTEDDQAETVLLRIVRGAGRRGLAGIRPRRGHLVRPLLGVSREELRAELAARGQEWREDATNLDLSNPRNRVRAELLPYLATHFNPSVKRALARLADVVGEEDAWLDAIAVQLGREAVRALDAEVRLDVTRFADLPTGLARRLARLALERADPGRFFTVREVDRLLAVVSGDRRAAEISGWRVERFAGSEVCISRAPAARPRRRGSGV